MTEKKSLLQIITESPLGNLKLIPRFSDMYMHRRETVADHNWDLIAISLVVVPYLNEGLTKKIDLKEVIYRVAVHDLDESGSIDIPRPFKYFDMELKEKLDEVAIKILRHKRVSEEIIRDIKSAKDYYVLEGLIVKILDTIQPGLVMIDEINLGNQSMKSQLPNIKEGITYYLEVIQYEDLNLEPALRMKLHEFLIEFNHYIDKFF